MRSWYLYDGLGSVLAEIGDLDSSYNVTLTAVPKTDVYGNPVTTQTGSSHRFCGGLGHKTDSDTGLVYMRARYYDPAIGRFVSEDPVRDGANLFAYCRNNPVNLIDVAGTTAQLDEAQMWGCFGVAAYIQAVIYTYLNKVNPGKMLNNAGLYYVAGCIALAAKCFQKEFEAEPVNLGSVPVSGILSETVDWVGVAGEFAGCAMAIAINLKAGDTLYNGIGMTAMIVLGMEAVVTLGAMAAIP